VELVEAVFLDLVVEGFAINTIIHFSITLCYLLTIELAYAIKRHPCRVIVHRQVVSHCAQCPAATPPLTGSSLVFGLQAPLRKISEVLGRHVATSLMSE
jgi:hypothetical protein